MLFRLFDEFYSELLLSSLFPFSVEVIVLADWLELCKESSSDKGLVIFSLQSLIFCIVAVSNIINQ